MNQRLLLVVDGVADLVLGAVLIVGRDPVFKFLGIPLPSTYFYPGILGGVLVGVGVALLIQCFRRTLPPGGLGILGATWINICGAVVLAGWVFTGRLGLPTRGVVLLSCISGVVLVIGALEIVSVARGAPGRDA